MKFTKLLTALLLITLLFATLTVGVMAAYTETEPVAPEEDPMYDTTTDVTWRIEPETARVLLIVISLVFAVSLPLVPLTIFTVKLIRRRKVFEVIDYIILGVSALWFLSGVLIFILIL